MLSAWLAEGSHTHLFLVGIGGLGKSALTWVWLHWDVMNQLLPGIDAESLRTEVTVSLRESHRPEGFIWWSFYEANATFSAFLDEALTYASNGEISPERIPSPYYKARMLLALLQQRKLLIIWDGFERLLKAYEGLGGGYREENERESDLRSCVEPLVEKFLVWLASTPIRSRFLVTSRLFPKDLEGVGGIPLASCRREDMTSLDPEDAITLFRLMGVKGTRFEINTVCASYGYHALALRLLCGYIVNHVSQANDIRVALQYDATEELIPRKHHILELAYNALEPSERLLLSRMAAFRSPVGHEAIAYLEVHQTKKGVERAIKVLANRGLIWLDRARGRCDMHPVVRRYAYDRLSDKETVHRRLRAYFATIPKPKYGIRSFEEIYPSIELFHHTVRARLYKDAFTLYKDDLKSMLVQLGAFQTEVELLRVFFRENESFEFLLDEEYDRNQLLLDLSIAYGYIGQERQALRFLEMINKLGSVEYFNTWNILGSMCYFQIKLGQLADATTYQQRAFEAANKSNDRDGQGYSRMMMGLILTIEGQLSKSLEEFRIARSLYRNFQGFNLVRECNLWNFRTIRASLIGEHHLAIVCGRHALSLAESFAEGRLLTRSKAYLASALIDLAVTEPERRNRLLSEAELLLTMALTQCRQLDLIEMEPFLLLAWARWNFLRGDRAQAKKGAEEALSLAQRCEFRLEQADINLFMAHLAFEGGALTLCRHHVEQSRQLAWCDGPPHYYKITFDKSEALLSKLR